MKVTEINFWFSMYNFVIVLNKGNLPAYFKVIDILAMVKCHYSESCSSPNFCPHFYLFV